MKKIFLLIVLIVLFVGGLYILEQEQPLMLDTTESDRILFRAEAADLNNFVVGAQNNILESYASLADLNETNSSEARRELLNQLILDTKSSSDAIDDYIISSEQNLIELKSASLLWHQEFLDLLEIEFSEAIDLFNASNKEQLNSLLQDINQESKQINERFIEVQESFISHYNLQTN